MDELHKSINPKILPKEYGGEVPLSVMISKIELFFDKNKLTYMLLYLTIESSQVN